MKRTENGKFEFISQKSLILILQKLRFISKVKNWTDLTKSVIELILMVCSE